MKTSIIALSLAGMLVFGTASAASSTASTAASPASPSAASPAASTAADAGKAATKDKTAKAKAAPAPKPMPAKTPPTATRGDKAQQSKMSACATANKGKTGDEYKSAMSDCLKASPADDAKK